MNKLSIMIKSVMIAMGMVGIAYADNRWTGFYVGMDAGVVFNSVQLTSQQLGFTNPDGTCNTNSDYSTSSPGIQLGYTYQFSNDLVSGIEANVSINTNQKNTLSCVCPFNPYVSDTFTFRNQMQSAIKGRVGRALNLGKSIFLPYVTAGASFANVGLTYTNEGGDYYSNTATQAGWLIGAGIEWAFSQHWSLRAEYYYVDYGNAINLNIPSVYGLSDPNGNAQVDLSSNNVAVAINYYI
ncbi:MAG: porin family protein [Gammaproteobacteria bacterium]|nr:MAG: porin family protein [Gammaproteobacteria bacterium]